MPCSSCGGTVAEQSFTGYRAMVSSNIEPDDQGFYHLYGEIPGEPLYTGAFQNDAIFAVAAGTPEQRLFKRQERQEAISHALHYGVTLDQYPTSNIAHSLILALYGA